MSYDWLLLDADDTLFDYGQAETKALRGVFAEFSLPFSPDVEAVYETVNGKIWKLFEQGQIKLDQLKVQRFIDLFAHLPFSVQDPQLFSKRYLYHLGQAADLLPFAEQVMAVLNKTHQLALITNGISEVQRSRLALSPFAHSFTALFISEEMGVSKPAAAFFDLVFAGIGHPPKERVLVIGDSLTSDMLGGVNYGLDTCWINPNQKTNPNGLPITYEIRDLRGLLKILELP